MPMGIAIGIPMGIATRIPIGIPMGIPIRIATGIAIGIPIISAETPIRASGHPKNGFE